MVLGMLFSWLRPVNAVDAAAQGRRLPPPPKEISTAALIDGVDWHIYIKDLHTNEMLLQLNADQVMHPASLIKVPIAVLVLAELQGDKMPIADMPVRGIKKQTYDQLISSMIVRSVEPSADILESYIKGAAFNITLLQDWGLKNTVLTPRRSTAADLGLLLEKLYRGELLNAEYTDYLLAKMSEYTPTDDEYLGVIKNRFPDSILYNKRGTLLAPVIVADMGILHTDTADYVIVISGNKQNTGPTFEEIKASLETFARHLALYLHGRTLDALP